jgi:G:T-mismatch repair DNA endonuclease (very short patch repair protein)
MKTKICSKCKKEKSLNEFSIRKNQKDGHNYYCKDCSRISNLKSKKIKCLDCDKLIWQGSIRCKKHARIYQYKINPKSNNFSGRKGKKSYSWKGGWKHFCIDCGKKIDFNAIRCKKHARIYQYQINPESHPFKGKHHNKKSKQKMSKATKRRWKKLGRTTMVKALRKNLQVYPNKPETIIKKLLSKLSKDYKYVGNGSVIIDGFNPDFININGQKKIIECYGTYWHKRQEVIERDKRRIKSYKRLGYSTLVIWEYELKDLNKVSNKISKFI